MATITTSIISICSSEFMSAAGFQLLDCGVEPNEIHTMLISYISTMPS